MKNKFRNFNIIVLILVAMASAALTGLHYYFSEFYILKMPEADYLANLRDNTEFGIRSFTKRQADILFVGDSHTYAAIDFNQVYKSLKGKKISSAAMGGFYFDGLEILLEKLDNDDYYPKTMIYGASLRQFVDSFSKADQLRQHKKILHENKLDMLKGLKRFLKYVLKKNVYLTNAKEEQKRISFHTEKLSQLDEAKLTLGFAKIKNDSTEMWNKKLSKDQVFMKDYQKHIDHLCEFVQKHKISLYVVNIPESPYLESLYTKTDHEKYIQILHAFDQCADKILTGGSSTYGLGNKHFVNREMSFGYEYDLWNKGEFDGDKLSFNLDHMNLIGAVVFTEGMLEKLGLNASKTVIE